MISPNEGAPGATDTDRKPKVALRTLGCKVNQVEAEQILAELLGAGYELAGEEGADVVVVNTCTVTGEADAKARKAIRHALSSNPAAMAVVTGCLASLHPADLGALDRRIVVEQDRSRVAEQVKRLCPVSPSGEQSAARARIGAGFHTRAMLKVEDGCDAFCTYCIVPFARGNPRSTPLSDLEDECGELISAGVSEIVLTGINIGRYDSEGIGLPGLVHRLAATGVPRLRLSSIEPPDLNGELLSVLACAPNVCHHLHVPLQSGDDRILSEMGRAYTTAQYADRIERAREALTGLAISTDVLVGFPGETDAEAERTLRFCREIGFDRLHVFRYSPRPGTPAAERVDQIEPRRRAERAGRARQLDRRLRSASAKRACGQTRELLVERLHRGPRPDSRIAEGTTEDYLRVRVEVVDPHADVAEGSLVEVRLVEVLEDGAIAATLHEGRNCNE